MHFLQFVFELAFVFISFDLLWNVFLFLLKNIAGIDRKRNTTAYYILKTASLYILSSLTVVVTFRHLEIHQGPFNHTTYPIIAFIILYLYIASSMQKSRMKAKLTMNTENMRRLRFNGLFLTSALVYFIIAIYLSVNNEKLFISWIIENKIVSWFFSTISGIYDILLLKIIIGFLAVLLMINMTIRGILVTRLLLFSFLGIQGKSKSNENPRLDKDGSEQKSEYTDYEIIDEEEINGEDDSSNRELN